MSPQRLACSVVTISLVFAAAHAFGQPVDSNIAVTDFAQHRGTPCDAGRGSAGCGGCYPGAINTTDPTSLLATVNPEWQPIGPMMPSGDTSLPPDSQPVLFTGTVALSKINIAGDFPASHFTTDQNTFITMDADKVGVLATGNNPTGCSGEGCNQIEMEREVAKYPLFAWADEGDRIAALGRWIFDCGHPNQAPAGKCSNNAAKDCAIDTDCGGGTCTSPVPNFNYRAELHPPQAIAVIRNKNSGKAPATRADVYISADGGGASDRCTVTHLASFAEVLATKACFVNKCSITTTQSCLVDTDCPKKETCVTLDPTQSVLNINASDFEFDMPLPPKPPGASAVKIKATSKLQPKPKGSVVPKATFQEHLTDPTPSIHVTVPMTVDVNGKKPNIFAQSITATWQKDPTKLTQVQVAFTGVTINNPVKPKTPVVTRQCTKVGGGLSGTPCTTNADCPGAQCVGGTPDGWEMFGEVNGDWVRFTGLDGVNVATAPKSSIPEKFKFTEYVATDGTIHIFALGHSFNCIDTQYGHNLIDGLNIYGLTTGALCLLNGMDADPGRIDVRHTGAGFATTSGTPTTCTSSKKGLTCTATASGGDAGTCSVSAGSCLTSADCPTGETCNVGGGAYTLQYTLKAK